MYFHFFSTVENLGTERVFGLEGFRLHFECLGSPLEYWNPAVVAIPMSAEPLPQMSLRAQQTACVSDVLMSVSCCSDAELSCANARVTELALSGSQLRGSLPDELGELGALRSLKLNRNFLKGNFPTSLKKLHWLKELQLSHNQFAMQTRGSLSAILGGMTQLRTLDIGMSSEKEDLGRSIITPAPPLRCTVGRACAFRVHTRTVDGLPLPHGGLEITVDIDDSAEAVVCDDLMDGDYAVRRTAALSLSFCRLTFRTNVFPASCPLEVCLAAAHNWAITRVLLHCRLEWGRVCANPAGEHYPFPNNFCFAPKGGRSGELFACFFLQVLDPVSGAVSTLETYSALEVRVLPIECKAPNSFPAADGSQCLCFAGFYRREYDGGYACETCAGGEQPDLTGTRCEGCRFGRYSSAGQACDECDEGHAPNSASDSCVFCVSTSVSSDGKECRRCSDDQEADDMRTHCICPRSTYNTSLLAAHAVRCMAKGLHGSEPAAAAIATCMPCGDLDCVACDAGGLVVYQPEYSIAVEPWLVFRCPFEGTCVQDMKTGQRCKTGHTGLLCAVCEVGFGLDRDNCVKCSRTNSNAAAGLLSAVCVLVGLVYLWRRRSMGVEATESESLSLQGLITNPLGASWDPQGSTTSFSTLGRAATTDIYMLLRVVYQPVRIVVGYIQVSLYHSCPVAPSERNSPGLA